MCIALSNFYFYVDFTVYEYAELIDSERIVKWTSLIQFPLTITYIYSGGRLLIIRILTKCVIDT